MVAYFKILLGVTTLETRRLRGDLIETYKILTHKERIDPNHFFKLCDSGHNLRGHSMKLYKPNVRLNVRKHFFGHRVIEHWNQLPTVMIVFGTVSDFPYTMTEVA